MRDIENDAQFTIRLPSKMKETVFELAKSKDMEGVAWIRQAIREKIDREKRAPAAALDEVDREAIRAVIKEELDRMERELDEKIQKKSGGL